MGSEAPHNMGDMGDQQEAGGREPGGEWAPSGPEDLGHPPWAPSPHPPHLRDLYQPLRVQMRN